MRKTRALNDTQMKYLLKNYHLSNQKLAELLDTTKDIIASYKSKARKAGVNIPYQKREGSTIGDRIRELAKEVIADQKK